MALPEEKAATSRPVSDVGCLSYQGGTSVPIVLCQPWTSSSCLAGASGALFKCRSRRTGARLAYILWRKGSSPLGNVGGIPVANFRRDSWFRHWPLEAELAITRQFPPGLGSRGEKSHDAPCVGLARGRRGETVATSNLLLPCTCFRQCSHESFTRPCIRLPSPTIARGRALLLIEISAE